MVEDRLSELRKEILPIIGPFLQEGLTIRLSKMSFLSSRCLLELRGLRQHLLRIKDSLSKIQIYLDDDFDLELRQLLESIQSNLHPEEDGDPEGQSDLSFCASPSSSSPLDHPDPLTS